MPSNPFTLYSIILFVTACVTGFLSCYSSRQQYYPVAQWFGWLMLSFTFYSLGYGMELACNSLSQIKFWINFEFVGAAFIPAFSLAMAFSYQRHRHPPFEFVVLLLLLSATTLVIQLGNDYHHFNFRSINFKQIDKVTISMLEFGPWYYFHLIYTNLAVLVTIIIFFHCWRTTPVFYRRQIAFIVCGYFIPWICYLIFLLGLAPKGIDLTPFGFMFTGLLFAYGLFRYRIIDLTPIARDKIFEEFSDAVLVVDKRRRLVDFNHQGRLLFHDLPHWIIGMDVKYILHKMNISPDTTFDETIPISFLNHRYYEIKCYRLCSDGPEAIGHTLVLRDVTERQMLLEQLREHAEIDELTSILNRRMILSKLDLMVLQQIPICILLFDLDNFKAINDIKGHQAGDLLLKQLSMLLREQMRTADSIGRYGGDEFLIILPKTNIEDAINIANRLNALCQQRLMVTLSIGIASMEESDSTATLIKRADEGLYKAKNYGRAQVCYVEAKKVYDR